MVHSSREAFFIVAIFLCVVMSDYVSDDDDFSLSGLTQEDPKYVSVVDETSDDEETGNYRALLECAKQLGGGDVREDTMGACDESNVADVIRAENVRAVVADLGLDIVKKNVASSEGTSNEEVCV